MLRLTVHSQSGEEILLIVDGWITGKDVALLEQEGERHLQRATRLVLDLEGVRFIDPSGVALLQRWAGERLALRRPSPFVQLVLEKHGLAALLEEGPSSGTPDRPNSPDPIDARPQRRRPGGKPPHKGGNHAVE